MNQSKGNNTLLDQFEREIIERATDSAWRASFVNHYFRPGIFIVIGMVISCIGIANMRAPHPETWAFLVGIGQIFLLIGIIRYGITPLVQQNNEIIKLLRQQKQPEDHQPK
jgi:hypothetical protein